MIGLDPHAIKELKKVFEELRDSGCMVLVSTHMIDSMEELWDTTYIMKQGRVAAVVERENLRITIKVWKIFSLRLQRARLWRERCR